MKDVPEPVVTEARGNALPPLLDRESSRLLDKFQALIVLWDQQGTTCKEAAWELNCPEETVVTRTRIGRPSLFGE